MNNSLYLKSQCDDKENLTKVYRFDISESIRKQSMNAFEDAFTDHVKKTELSIKELQKQLRGKVSKTQFLSGLGSKLSISEVGNICHERERKEDSKNRQRDR